MKMGRHSRPNELRHRRRPGRRALPDARLAARPGANHPVPFKSESWKKEMS